MTTTVTTSSQTATTVVVSESGGQGLPGADGSDGSGFNQVRKSKLDNPLCHLFKTNKLVEASAPTGTDSDVTWTRSTTGTYIDRYGVLQAASIDEPREEKEGFLIEGASTNITLQSEDFSTTWTQSLATISSNSTVAPDGAVTADKLIPNNGVSNGSFRQVITTTGGEAVYCSVFAKADAFTNISFFIDTGSIFASISVDLSDGSFSTSSAASNGRVDSLADGWLRCSFSADIDVGHTAPLVILECTDAGNATDGVWFWGAQVETNFRSSYIKTTASSVTRATDIVNYTATNNMGLLSGNNTIVADVGATSGTTLANSRIINVKASGSTTDNQRAIALQGSNQLNLITFSGEVQSGATFTADALGVVVSVANFDTDTLDAYSEGSLSGSISMAASVFASVIPETISFIANSSGVTQDISTHIKDFRVYDFALNADEVEYLS